MNKHLRRFTTLLAIGTLLWATKKFCHAQTDGFQIVKIFSHLDPSQEWELPSNSQEIAELQNILDQPFHYLGCGGQAYAFLSEDGRIVLKFLKMHHLRQYSWLQGIPLPLIMDIGRQKFLFHQRQKLQKVFSSCKIAYTELKNETGLIFANLNPNAQLAPFKVKLTDKLHIQHELHLANVPFVLQYRADNAFQKMRVHLKKQEIEEAKKIVSEIVAFLTARYQKGIQDLDPAPRRNIGLYEDKAIAIDIGSFFHPSTPLTKEEAKQELENDTRRMRKWLVKRSPELTMHFDELIDAAP